ncbi:MAG TPA: S9 family peptidase [Actinobacteria bacterium]|nr:S9 family peptidase [Actinomycetota bacterium]
MSTDSFPRRSALTRGFRLGAPRTFAISADGSRVLFLRSRHGTDSVNCLWVLNVATGEENCVADPVAMSFSSAGDIPAEERARRERAREVAGGIVTYSADADCARAVVTINGVAFLVDVKSSQVSELALPSPVIDPRIDRSGRRIAFVHDNAVWVHDLTGLASTSAVRITPAETSPHITWGIADFIAGEEMDRTRGTWWTHNGSALLVQRTDVSAVAELTIENPVDPDSPMVTRYPAAGTTNAAVTLHRVGLDGSQVEIDWDHSTYEYLVDVITDSHGELLVVQSRDQRRYQVLTISREGATSVLSDTTDPAWVELISGSPVRTESGQLASVRDDHDNDHRRLFINVEPVSPIGWDVRAITGVDFNTVFFTACPSHDSWVCDLWSWNETDGSVQLSAGGWTSGTSRSGTSVISRNSLEVGASDVVVTSAHGIHTVESFAEGPSVTPVVYRVDGDEPHLRIAVLFPEGKLPGQALPVLLDPYGGPHGQRVVNAGSAFLTAQWWADQGFVVIVTDGRGMPGSPSWEKSVKDDLASGVLADQVSALELVTAKFPGKLDRSRVGIRGWSFGGYLAALAVLDRPDVFHAAVAGAPVTEWRLYDTHYTERYLGDPRTQPDVYDANSLLPRAPQLSRPLLLIHGVDDDNVFVSNTAQLSAALTAAGKEHQVEYLTGVTHMTPQEEVAENLLILQLDFLKKSLT